MKTVVALLTMLVLAVAGCSDGNGVGSTGTTAKKVVELKMHHHEAAGNALDLYFQKWARKVEQDANGTLKITIFPGASLGSPKTALDMLSTSVCDIALAFSGFFPGRFPLTDAISLPMLNLQTAMDGTKVLNQMFQETDYIKGEFDEFKVLWMNTISQNPIVTRGKRISTLEDLQGLAIRVPGGPPTQFALALGYSPIGMGPGDIFSSIEKNVISGYVIDWAGIDNFKLYEVSDYYLNFTHYVMPFYCLMNKQKFNDLPEEAKQALEKNSGTTVAFEVAAVFDGLYQDAILPNIKKRGAEIVTLSAAETEKFRAKAEQVRREWIAETEKNGLPGQRVFDTYVEFAQRLH